ncbi:MAG: Gluconeogenesis factor [Anaerolineales bacterium]|nr:YvcK family protein [Anaerolineae bacterium]MBL8104055.1 YvcK family protein [Anaerolineales bacterium]MBV6401133.1 Gluconeogenesis factor [Anaerolineales bacterium]MCC7190820.1 YvcK family protein [Anaerolineales bacterium]HQU35305.1 YvcK family protein [Anaerolineales bacterium]
MPNKKNSQVTRLLEEFREIARWFAPGLGIKRWFLFIMAGITLLGVGLAMLLLDLYRTDSTNETLLAILSYASLRFLPRILRILVFGGIGLWLVGYGIVRLNRSLLRPYLRSGRILLNDLTDFRRRERGPRIVAVGGGHGLASLLRGLKTWTRNLTAVVTVADDGGSSGRLRADFGILPPGDIRNCLAALSNDEQMLTQLFQYRFSGAGDLSGHSFGNLFITALADITGSFEGAVEESGRVLSVSGRVLPSTLHDVKLVADMQLPHTMNQVRVEGESRIPQMAGRVSRIWLEPNDAPAYPPVLKAILGADMIVIGPGSLYTSILPNLLVQDLLGAIRASRAVKVYVCNLATQSGETDLFSCYDHVRALEEHVGDNLFDVVLCNSNYEGALNEGSQWVKADEKILADARAFCTDLIHETQPWRHDSSKLATALNDVLEEYSSPLG